MGENLSIVPAVEATRPPVRLLLVDDHQVVLEGLASMLASQSDRVVIAAATTDAGEALRLAADRQPDVVLLDVRLRGASGLDLCAELVRRHPGIKVVFFTVYDDEQYLFQALRAGAAGYLLKRVEGEELVRQLCRASDGEIVIDSALAGRVATAAARIEAGEFWPGARLGLTQRESEVLALIVAGMTNGAIAGRLVVGEETVKTHVRAIYRKLEVPDRSGAVARALREGLFL